MVDFSPKRLGKRGSRWYMSKSGVECRRIHLTLAFTREDWERLQRLAKQHGSSAKTLLAGWALDAVYFNENKDIGVEVEK